MINVFSYLQLYKKFRNTISRMCGVGSTFFGHAWTSFMDILMASVGIFLRWEEHDDCMMVNQADWVSMIGQFKLVGHVVEIVLQFYVKETKQLGIDDQFNPKSFWVGFAFTILHATGYILTCFSLIPGFHYTYGSKGECVHRIDIFAVMLLFSGFVVILFRSLLHKAHRNSL